MGLTLPYLDSVQQFGGKSSATSGDEGKEFS